MYCNAPYLRIRRLCRQRFPIPQIVLIKRLFIAACAQRLTSPRDPSLRIPSLRSIVYLRKSVQIMRPHRTEGLAFLATPAAFSQILRKVITVFDFSANHYCLPITLVALIVRFIVWRFQSIELDRLCDALKRSSDLQHQLARERNQAQEEIFRRLHEDRELNKQKFQFQAQLAEYEKYSTLAQFALGAAHGINNPLLGILSHLELEMKSA